MGKAEASEAVNKRKPQPIKFFRMIDDRYWNLFVVRLVSVYYTGTGYVRAVSGYTGGSMVKLPRAVLVLKVNPSAAYWFDTK